MYVCVCNAVTERDIRNAAEQGARTLRSLNLQLGVAADCGRCARCARQVLKDHLSRRSSVKSVLALAGI